MVPGLTRRSLDELTVRVLRPCERARPDVRIVNILDGRLCVVKDYARDAPPFKRLLGAFLVWRERVAFQRAAGVEGVPAFVGTLGWCALVTEYVDAEEATSSAQEMLDAGFFQGLERTVRSLHARGVVHGDLKKLENILVTPDGKPVLVDFTAAFVTGSNPITAAIFPWISDDDLRAIAKLKLRRAPELLTEVQQEFLEERSAIERFFRWFRRYIRYAVKRYSTPEQERAEIRLK